MELILGIIFAALPIFSYYLQKHYSKKQKRYSSFLTHWTARYSDWIFIPFNLFLFYTIFIDYLLLIMLAISFVFNYFFHRLWAKNTKEDSHFFIKNKFSKAGLVHLTFSTIQAALILTFLFSKVLNIFTFINLGILLIFAVLIPIGSINIHKKLMKGDLFVALILFLFILLRIIFSL